MNRRKIHGKPELKQHRRHLRQAMTPAEARMWQVLRSNQLQGRKFRRQHSIGPFIVDFYCPQEKIIIELDGEVHNTDQAHEYDAERQAGLQKLGYTVLRYENRRVFEDMDNVLTDIVRHFSQE